MSEGREYSKLIPEKKELSFNEGVEKVMQVIEQLLNSQDYVVVGIAGPDYDDGCVGKTTLAGIISQKLKRLYIPIFKTDQLHYFNKDSVRDLKDYQRFTRSKKGVIIFGALSFLSADIPEDKLKLFRQIQDSEVHKIGKKYKLPLSKIDLRVLIYSPDRKNRATSPIADIFIENEFANRKYRD